MIIESYVESDSLIHLPHNRDNQTPGIQSLLAKLVNGQLQTTEGRRKKGMGYGCDSSQ